MKVSRIPIYILVTINVAVVLGLWLSGWCGFMNPNTYGWLSLIGYAFPAFLLATIAFLFVWIVIKKRFILISFLGLLVAYHPVTLYFPINSTTASNELPDSLITLLSYNTCGWGNMPTSPENNKKSKEEVREMLLDFFKEQNADILTLQEAPYNGNMQPLYDQYEYNDSAIRSSSGSHIAIFSRFPITKKQNFNIESKGNVAAAFWLNIRGREVIVINFHLETMHFTINERTQFSQMVHGNRNEKDSIRSTSQTILGKIYSATKRRADQADIISEFIASHSGTPIIVMGDFNDIPQSYVHDKICGYMTDCFGATGFGPGYTFKHFAIRVRIDNIMCSDHFTPYNCHIIKDISVSDHQPVTVKLKMTPPLTLPREGV